MGKKLVITIEQKRECQVQINVGDELNIENHEAVSFLRDNAEQIIDYCVDDSDWVYSPPEVDTLSVEEVFADTNNPIYEFDGDWLDE